MKGTILTEIKLDNLPKYAEFGIRRLTEEEVKTYKKLEYVTEWGNDFKEGIVFNYGVWYLVKRI
ncbi:MAG TPA: hypothetical protein PKN66_09600 [Thermodesulfovibrio thiophilus]|nr:hypothetical protein [Thermodesulfovibrio thiophilus]